MKRLRIFSLFLVVNLILCGCHEPGSQSGATITEPEDSKVRITAPFDILADTPELTADFDMNIVDGYALITDPHEGKHSQQIYYAYMTSAYGFIWIIPEIVELGLMEKTLTYIAQTNYGGFFDEVQSYKGNVAAFDSYIRWRGAWSISACENKVPPEKCWLDLVVKVDETVVGVIVYELVDWEEYSEDSFTIELSYSECYLTTDGELQDVTEDFAWQRIEAYHQYEEQKTE